MSNRTSVINKIKECIAIAEKHYGRAISMPNVRFTKRGTTSGTASYSKWELNFNEALLDANFDKFMESTVPHEAAHLIDHAVNGSLHFKFDRFGKRQKRQPHGTNWKLIMRVLGAEPKRCHSYDVSEVRQAKRKVEQFNYQCTGCKQTMPMGKIRHNKQQSGAAKYSHNSCKGHQLIYVGKA